ncbi:MAG: HAMP domain-containing protein [Thiomargarita sp.]|nr:HAMP domain-containing protein [Thiomargarita sp.]
MFNGTIRTKLTLSNTLLIAIAIAVISIVIGYQVNQMAEHDTQLIAKEMAYHYANKVKAELEKPLYEARAIANLFEIASRLKKLEITRDKVNLWLKNFIEHEPNFLGIGIVCESDAFFEKDKKYVNKLGHDASGRLASYWSWGETGKGTLSTLIDYKTQDFYQLAKQKVSEIIVEPSPLTIQDREVWATTLAAPIMINSEQFLGVIKIDLSLEYLQNQLGNLKISGFDDAYINVYSANGMVIASKNSAYLGKNVKETTYNHKMIEHILKQEAFLVTRESNTLQETVITYGAPVEIANTGIRWMVAVSIPEHQLAVISEQVIGWIIFIGIITMLIMTIVIFLLSKTISEPLKYLVTVSKAIAMGNLNNEIELDRKDEIGQLLRAVESMQIQLRNIVTTISKTVDVINTAAEEISQGNLSLSQRTEKQAASLEETAASMEEMTSTVQHNADNAKQASQLAINAKETAMQGGKVVNKTICAMAEINKSSNKVTEIISVINDIAFQTNLLALNAAVEAARAGDAGRGFAVVASEVRKLAQRSAEAAKEIKELIQDSVSNVHEGTQLANDSGDTLEEIITAVKKVSDIIAEIAAASQEQSLGIHQVNKSISQMDEMTQKNAALVEEAATTSSVMEEQALSLKEQVSFFDVGEQILPSKKKKPNISKPSNNIIISSPNRYSPKILPFDDENDWKDF